MNDGDETRSEKSQCQLTRGDNDSRPERAKRRGACLLLIRATLVRLGLSHGASFAVEKEQVCEWSVLCRIVEFFGADSCDLHEVHASCQMAVVASDVQRFATRKKRALRGYAGSGDVECAKQGHRDSQSQRASISILFTHLWGKILLFEPACAHRWSALFAPRPSRWATFRDVACVQLASATAPPSSSGKQSGLVARTSMSASSWLSVRWSPLTASTRR